MIEEYDFIYATIGWHPVDAIDMTEEDLAWIKELSAHEKWQRQVKWDWIIIGINLLKMFKRGVQKTNRLSKEVNLPIIIHNRDATEDVVTILKRKAQKPWAESCTALQEVRKWQENA